MVLQSHASSDTSHGTGPRLLVSVRSPQEALAAIAGGCDILDMKEPDAGALGAVPSAVGCSIIEAVRRVNPRIPISAALGEAHEWLPVAAPVDPSGASVTAASQRQPQYVHDCQYLKLGTATLASRPDWQLHLKQIRDQIRGGEVSRPGWVAVAYADGELVGAPAVYAVAQAALQDGSRGLLIDTATKSGHRLLDWLNVRELAQIADQVHQQGLFLALAGSLNASLISSLAAIPVDILAIRGAACVNGQRRAEVQVDAVRSFRQRMHEVWPD